MADPSIPGAIYRLQFNGGFRLQDATDLVGYLANLGITDIYASPILKSRKGSMHGYDVTDPSQIDPDIGSAQDFDNLQNELLNHGMRLVLDIVPNHMAAGSENRWWMDVLENGSESVFSSYFDIDWHPPVRDLDEKVLLPVLGRSFGEALDHGELRLVFEDGKFYIRYFDSIFPLRARSYRRVLKHRIEDLKNSLSEESTAYQEYSGIIAALSSFSDTKPASDSEKRVRFDAIRERLQRLIEGNAEIAAFIQSNVDDFNGVQGDAASMCALEHLLDEQHFRLAYWQDPNEAINYRRFFAITDLVGIRVEDPPVFNATHDQIFHLSARGAVRGLRVDHIDGLQDPVGYLNRLHERWAESLPPQSAGPFIVVEKILSAGEVLPEDWRVSGTTGYEYLNAANDLFVFPPGAEKLNKVFSNFISKEMSYPDLVYEKKKLVMNTLLRVEMRSLCRQLIELAAHDRYARNLVRLELMDALIEVTACFPVYRTYIRTLEVPDAAKLLIERAIEEARIRRPRLSAACFSFLRDVLTIANPPHIFSDQREERLNFVKRWQQFTGPIVAKGVEDTALFVYYPLLSLNEVGGNPEPSGVISREEFFDFIKARQEKWPNTINATSTHDTKTSEGVRARLNVLSEIPEEWQSKISEWSRENQSKKRMVEGRSVPDANEEYLIYQALLGLWTGRCEDLPAIGERLKSYAVKAIREAMVHTRWTEPNTAHEDAIHGFTNRILDRQRNPIFLQSFARLEEKIAYPGMVNSLGQTLLKIICLGVPDFYQGSEFWDLHLVDPDNRSPVDFRQRRQALENMINAADADLPRITRELLAAWTDGRVKLYVIWKALGLRRQYSSLFQDGEFLPLEVSGEKSRHIVAFLRRKGNDQVIAVIPRWTMNAPTCLDASTCEEFWKGTTVRLPSESPRSWQNVFTTCAAPVKPEAAALCIPVGSILKHFPVALLATAPDRL